MSTAEIQAWDARFEGADYLFGTEPNAFLLQAVGHLAPSGRVLAVADGEGRNGVWLAEQGFAVHSVEGSPTAVAKAIRLAQTRGVRVVDSLDTLAPGSIYPAVGDVLAHDWPMDAYDAVVAIFIQFAKPGQERDALFAAMGSALVDGGVLLLEGYSPKQLEYGTGGPQAVEHLYTAEFLRQAFAQLQIGSVAEYDVELREGTQHSGMSAVIDLVATRQG